MTISLIFTTFVVIIISFYLGYKLGKDKDYVEKLEKKIRGPRREFKAYSPSLEEQAEMEEERKRIEWESTEEGKIEKQFAKERGEK